MKYLLLIVAIAAGAYFFPQLYEEVGSPCLALEKKFMREQNGDTNINQTLSGLALSLTGGKLGEQMADDIYPDLPSRFACVATYYDFPEKWQP